MVRGLALDDPLRLLGRYFFEASLFRLRQRVLQYLTSSQTLLHFFLQLKGRPQTTQTLLGRFFFE